MKITIIVLFISLQTLTAWSQEFAAQSALPHVNRDGFYKVMLPPEVSSYTNTSFSNLRIVDAGGIQVPFVIGEDKEVGAVTEFIPYAIEERVILTDSCTILVLKNNSKNSINNINLVIRNAAILKEAVLYGSDDKKTWYALKDKFTLGNIQNEQGTAEIKIIDFPASDYTYYKLWINDKESAPLNVVQVGYYRNIARELKYEEVAIRRVSQENDQKEKKSYISISMDALHTVDRIDWRVSGAPFYQRAASLYTMRETTDQKGRSRPYRDYIATFQINSRHENIRYLPATRTDNLLLEVANDDNPPLTIEEVKLYQISRYVVTWLRKDESYMLKFANGEIAAPVYDLELFKDIIPATLSVITPGEVSVIEPAARSAQTTVFSTKLYIWVAIAIVIIVLGIMSVKMIRETPSTGSRADGD